MMHRREHNPTEPLVSVIIPTYNSAAYLAASLDSVLNQSYTNFEVLVIDDGSTDDTAAVIAPYLAACADRLRYIQKPNGGPSSARNLGIRQSSGDLIAFQDADDLWLTEKLRLQVEHFLNHPQAGVVFTDSARFDVQGKFSRSFRETHGYISSHQIFDALLSTHFIAMPSVMIRRHCLEDVGGFDETLRGSEDYNLYLRLARKYRFEFIDRVLVHVRAHSESLSENLDQMCRDEILNVHKIADLFPDVAISRRVLIGKIYARFGRYYFSQQRFAEARRCFQKAFAHTPFLFRSYPMFALSATPESIREPLLSINKTVKRSRNGAGSR